MWSGWSAVADVGGAGCGSGVLDEDLAFEVCDGDLVAVDDDEDLLEAVLGASGGHCVIARLTRGSTDSFLDTRSRPAPGATD